MVLPREELDGQSYGACLLADLHFEDDTIEETRSVSRK